MNGKDTNIGIRKPIRSSREEVFSDWRAPTLYGMVCRPAGSRCYVSLREGGIAWNVQVHNADFVTLVIPCIVT